LGGTFTNNIYLYSLLKEPPGLPGFGARIDDGMALMQFSSSISLISSESILLTTKSDFLLQVTSLFMIQIIRATG